MQDGFHNEDKSYDHILIFIKIQYLLLIETLRQFGIASNFLENNEEIYKTPIFIIICNGRKLNTVLLTSVTWQESLLFHSYSI